VWPARHVRLHGGIHPKTAQARWAVGIIRFLVKHITVRDSHKPSKTGFKLFTVKQKPEL
jgi:hypothetical protein